MRFKEEETSEQKAVSPSGTKPSQTRYNVLAQDDVGPTEHVQSCPNVMRIQEDPDRGTLTFRSI